MLIMSAKLGQACYDFKELAKQCEDELLCY
jgi:hypothetical protein